MTGSGLLNLVPGAAGGGIVAKGGGGSWKVAYADFVTAMMAFFLVMWIGAQDVKVRQSVANYFVDPAGVNKKPVSAGAVMNETVSGPVPKDSAVNTGGGSHAPGGQPPSPSTAAVIGWIKDKPDRLQYWKAQAQRCRDAATAQKAGNQSKPPDEIANEQLSAMLKSELFEGLPAQTPEVYKRMVLESLKGVDWNQVANDVLRS